MPTFEEKFGLKYIQLNRVTLIHKTFKSVAVIWDLLDICMIASHCGASDCVANFSALSNPADAQNVSCLELCGRDIKP